MLGDEEARKALFECLASIRKTSRSITLVETDTHRFLHNLNQSSKLQRCYTQNFDGLEARAGLNVDLQLNDCKAVQLHGNLDSLRCTFCGQCTEWTSVDQTILLSGKTIPCPECTSRLELRRIKGARTNIHVGSLRPNIVFFGDYDDPSSERKAELMRQDGALEPDVLLIIGTSLTIDGIKSALRTIFIPAVRRSGGKVVYVNNVQPPKAFSKPRVDYIFQMDCDQWVQTLMHHETSLPLMVSVPALSPLVERDDSLQVRGIAEAIQVAEASLISIGDYSDIQYRLRNSAEVRRELSCFHVGSWLSTSPLMCILLLFDWGETTKILHSDLMNFDPSDAHARSRLLRGPVWPVGRRHTRVVVPHNPGNHWILIVVDISHRVVYYYNSLPGHAIDASIQFVQAQMARVGDPINKDYSTWNAPTDGVSLLVFT